MESATPRPTAPGQPAHHQRIPLRISELLSKAGVPGASIAIASRGSPTVTWVHGVARIHPRLPADDDTVYHLFSGTKLYTATTLMRLVEQGRVELDESVQTYLPDLPLRFPITLRQLASHDSGLPETIRALLSTHLHGHPAPSTAEALSRYGLDKGSAPGKGAAYRNANYAILGELISRVAGSPYEVFVRDEVLGPLGSGARFSYSTESLERAATGYSPRFSFMRLALRLLMPVDSRPVFRGASGNLIGLEPFALDTTAIGGLVGTANDFVPLVREMLEPGDGLLSARSKREMLTLQAKGPAGIVSRVGVGLGWKLGRIEGVEFWNHEGGGPGFCSETRLYPDEGLGVIILMNLAQSTKLSRVAHGVCEAIRRHRLNQRA